MSRTDAMRRRPVGSSPRSPRLARCLDFRTRPEDAARMPLSTPQPQPQPTAPRGRHPDASTGRRRALVALSSLLVLGMLGFGVLGFGPLGAGRIERNPPSSVGSHVGGSQSGTRDGKPNASAERPRLLVFTKTAGFRHDSIPTGIAAVRELLSDRFEIDATEDAAVFEAANLARYRAVVFLSTTGDILDEAQQRAFEGFIRSGGGFAGIHAAADTEHTWPWYGKLVGAYFKTHPDIQEALVRVEDKRHPSTVMLPTEWRRTDEWYVYSSNPRSRVQVLASVDDSTIQGVSMGGDHPIAWFHVFEGGRSWYTGGGHTHESFAEPLFRAHIEGGILWAAGAADIVTAGESDKPADGAGHAAPARESGKAPRDAPAADKPPATPR